MKLLIDHINSSISGLNLFNAIHGLCELQSKDSVAFPAEYCGKGEYKQLKLDGAVSEIYHRHNGRVSRETGAQVSGCDTVMKQTYPMLLIGFVSRKTDGIDDKYTPDIIASNIINAIEFKNSKQLNRLIKAISSQVNVNSYSVDSISIFNREFKGNKREDFDKKYFMFEVEYEIVVEGSKSCFQYLCESEDAFILQETSAFLLQESSGKLILT